MGDGEWNIVSDVNGCSFSRDDENDNLYRIKIRPDYQNVTGDVTLRVTGEQHGRYSITWENATGEFIDLEKSVLPDMSIDGETVTAEIWVNDGQYLNTAASSVEGLDLEVTARSYAEFVMPAEDVTITLDIREKIPVTYTESENVAEATFYDADDMFYGIETSIGIPGEPVYLFASAADGFKPMYAVTDAGEKFEFEHYAYAIFMAEVIIPEDAENLSVSIETAQAWTATGDGNIVFNYGNLYAEGETVSMSIYVPDGQRITSVTAKDSEGNDITVELDLPYASFTMPASDVTVSVEYEDLDQSETVSVIANFDEGLYDVSSSTNYDWDFTEGFTVNRGSTFYLSVYNYDGTNFYVGVKTGDTVTIYPADFDDMMGEYSFGKALVADGDVTIKIGASEDEVSF